MSRPSDFQSDRRRVKIPTKWPSPEGQSIHNNYPVIQEDGTLPASMIAAHATTHIRGGSDPVGSDYNDPYVIPYSDSRGYLNDRIDAFNALSLNELADGASEYLSRFDHLVKSLASGSTTTLKIKDDFWGASVTWHGAIYNEGGGYTTITTEEAQAFEDGTTSKILGPYEAAIIYARSPGVWNVWNVFNTRNAVTATTIYTPTTGAKKTYFRTVDTSSGFETVLHNGTAHLVSTVGSWGIGGWNVIEFEGLPGQGSVGQFMLAQMLDGYLNWHPVNARPPETGYTRLWMSDGISGYSQAKIAVQSGQTGVDLDTKILADMDLDNMTSGNATIGNLPEFVGAGAEITDSGIPTSSLDQFKAGIVGANLTADVNDFTVTGLGNTQLLLLDPDADGWKVGGIQTGAIARRLTIFNASSAYYILIEHNGSGSSAGNKIYTYTGLDFYLGKGCSVTLAYDDSASAWRIVGEVGMANPILGSGSPIGVVRPRCHGDRYHDTVGLIGYEAFGTTSADWRRIATVDPPDGGGVINE